MFRMLSVWGLFLLLMVWRQDASKDQEASSRATTHSASQTDKPMPPPNAVVNPVPASPPRTPATADQQNQSPPNSVKWFLRPEWVIVWVTVTYTVLTGLTLLSIKRQADLMESQAKDARESARDSALMAQSTLEAIKGQIEVLREQNAISRAQGRAKISADVRIPPEITPHPCFGNTFRITVNAVNAGSSTAFNVQAFGIIFIEELEVQGGRVVVSAHPESWTELDIESTIPPTEGQLPVSIPITEVGSPGGGLIQVGDLFFDEQRIKQITGSKRFIRVDGAISYDDTFGDKHTTPFLYVWENIGDDSESQLWRDLAHWINLSGQST